MLPVALVLLVAGIWTGHLVLTERSTPVTSRETRAARKTRLASLWWCWIVVSVVCFAAGFAIALVGEQFLEPGVDDNSVAATAVGLGGC